VSVRDDQSFDEEHFDEVDAVRRFPREDEWLDLEAEDVEAEDLEAEDLDRSGAEAQDAEAQDAEAQDADGSGPTSFVDRVMHAREAEQRLDSQLADLDKLLPQDLLQQLQAPTPSDTFVDETVAAAMTDRRNRWQQMLSRHVTPTPSTVFVSRTLDALQDERASSGGGAQVASATTHSTASPKASPTTNPTASPPAQIPHTAAQSKRNNWPVFSLVSAAAAAMLWVVLTDSPLPPLEARLANQASPAAAYSEATTPMSAILARVADEEEPFSVFDAPADGLWLVSTKQEVR
jgi:hypothetical protein